MSKRFQMTHERTRFSALCTTALLAMLIVFDATNHIAAFSTFLVIATLWAVLEILRLVKTAADNAGVLSLPLAIASDTETLDLYQAIGTGLRDVAANLDPVYRELAIGRVRQLAEESKAIGRGEIVFEGTEFWRDAYEKLLRSRGLGRYRSVAYIHTPAYWQDEPGRQSMRVNYDAARSGLNIQRIAIVADELWPTGERLPIDPIGSWLEEQARQEIQIRLVRESKVDADLLSDFGIYGNRAAGRQVVDEQGRTVRFALSFDFSELLAAESRWERLEIYAVDLREILDPSTSRP